MSVDTLEKSAAAASSDLAEKVQWLMDRTEIEDLLARYSRGIDRADIEVLKSVYHDDAIDEHGIFSGTGHEFAEWVVPLIKTTYESIHHNFSTNSIEIQNDVAYSEIYFICINKYPDNRLEFCGGRCADRFEKRAGKWKIAHRQVIMDWTEMTEGVKPSEMDPAFAKSGFASADPSYDRIPLLRAGGFFPGRGR